MDGFWTSRRSSIKEKKGQAEKRRKKWLCRVRYCAVLRVYAYSTACLLLEMFINDDIEDEGSPTIHRVFKDNREDDQAELHDAYDALLDRALGDSRYAPIQYYSTWGPTDEEAERVEAILRYPTLEDPPLYRVACRVSALFVRSQ